jgi:uncharacterized SAM-binding protein YcdF (DUF218 family)
MFFVLSKTVALLVMPLTLIVIFIVASLIVKRPKLKKLFFWTGFGLLLFFSNGTIANELIIWWELPATPYNEVRPHKLGIVLTGTTIRKPFPDDRVYFSHGADRVTHTVELYKKGLIEKILISGGSGLLVSEEEPEANKYRKVMLLMGVDSTDIMIENATRNTYESAVAVKPMLRKMNYTEKDCILITSAFHMRRSLAVYRKAGLELDYFTTDFYSLPRTYYPDALIIPKVEALEIWQKLFKEWIGLAAYKVAGYV